MSTRLRLFYASRLGNRVHYTFIFTFVVLLFRKFFVCFFFIIRNYILMTLVGGDPKAPFSIATTPRCRGGRYSIPRLLHFTLDPHLIMLRRNQVPLIESLVWLDLVLNPGLPDHWRTPCSLDQWPGRNYITNTNTCIRMLLNIPV